MTYCFNPTCTKPTNRHEAEVCENCGAKLLLQDRYQILKLLGQGGFGKTFLAVDLLDPTKPRCVVKQFFPQVHSREQQEKAAELFLQEAQRLETLGNHPRIPKFLAHFTEDNRQYLVQEFIDGQNLAQEMDERGCLDESQIRQLLIDLLPVLRFIHLHEIIHRDIKPANIIRRSKDRRLVLVDFGAAKFATGTALIRTGTVIGSAEYTAPEQGRGKAVFASDIYSLGVTCIHLLTNVPPFDLFDSSEGVWVWRQYLKNPVGESLGRILDKAIEFTTSKRYYSVGDVILDLNHFITETRTNETKTESLNLKPALVLGGFALASAAFLFSLTHLLVNIPVMPVSQLLPRKIQSIGYPPPSAWKRIQNIRILSGHSRSVFSLSISPDGQTLASSGWDRKIILWHVPTGKIIKSWVGHSSLVASVAISADGQYLVSGGDSNIKLWDIASGNLQSTFASHTKQISSVAISRDGRTLASSSFDGTIKLWDLKTNQFLKTILPTSGKVHSVAFASDGRTLVSGDDSSVKTWDISTGVRSNVLTGNTKLINKVKVSPDGQIAIAASDDRTIKIWHLASGQLLATLNDTNEVWAIAISPDGQTLALGGKEGEIKIWNLYDLSLVNVLRAHRGGVIDLTFSPNGRMLFSSGVDSSVKVWQLDR